jgi:uncharacterized membrane protein YjjB (DUF3815 family)
VISGLLAALLGVMAFAILFQVPRRYYLPCAVVGALVWLLNQLLLWVGAGEVAACLGAAFLLTILARTLAVLWRVPVSIFLIPGIFTLVPGTGIFYLGYYLMSSQTAQLSAKATQVLLTAGAIAVGITFGSAPSQKWFTKLAELITRCFARLGRKRKG